MSIGQPSAFLECSKQGGFVLLMTEKLIETPLHVISCEGCEKLCMFTPYQGTVFWHLEIQRSCKAFFSGKSS